MKKLTIFAFLVFTAFTSNNAQQSNPQTSSPNKKIVTEKAVSRIGLVAGLGFSKGRFIADGMDVFNESLKSRTTGSAMFFWENGKSENFITQVGLGYAGKGYKMDGFDFNIHYIELPIIMNFRLPIAGPVYLMAGFGPNFSVAFSAIQKDGDVSIRDVLEYKAGIKPNSAKAYNPVDVGLIFNACVEINFPQGKVLEVGANYKLGLNKISNNSQFWTVDGIEPYNPGYKTGVFSITVAYLLDRKKKD